jgi:acetyltransferase-like isoleucine patch superfamily enzyme
MLRTIKRIWGLLRKHIFIKLNVVLTVVIFLLREFFLGFENASNYLKSVSQTSIIPILKMKGALIGQKCTIDSGIVFHNCQNYTNLSVGSNCHIGKNCFFDLREKVIIGNNVVISMNNTFIDHLDMSNSHLRFSYPATKQPIEIKDDVYIGSNSTVLMGVTIGAAGFVASNALVIKDVEASTMVGGIPAKKIKIIDGI